MDFKRVVNIIPLTRVALTSTQIFSYTVPLKLHGQIRPGMLVRIPFGGRRLAGIVSSPEMPRIGNEIKNFKPVFEILSTAPLLNEKGFQLANWLAEYYAAPLGLAVKAMLPRLTKKITPPVLIDFEKYNPDFVLTENQRQAVTQISGALGKSETFLLFGVTGSGKTEVYMQVMERVLESGQQVIMLVPEISLTPQALERFSKRFGFENIAMLHSRMKATEKMWMWQKIRSEEKHIIIGPRSAIFAPVQNLGLLILDEEHDSSFKQYDQNPKYHARTVAKKLSEIWSCPVILGDATPSVDSFYEAAAGQSKLERLPYRIKADVGLPKITVVDMKKEKEQGGVSIFSDYLKYEIIENLHKKRQIILFLNRRGAANFVMCRDCGFVLPCKRCSVSLVWHSWRGSLLCHHCGEAYELPPFCPNCRGANFKHFGIGTQSVEEEIKKFLTKEFTGEMPAIARMDRDTTSASDDGHGKIYREWASGKIRILIGTQMISKGWDVSGVGLVGIVSADTALYLPDFRTNEKVFQMLVQVAGRAGRGKEVGTVILQTFNPDNRAIQAARLQDFESFYKDEIGARQKYGYPPFSKIVKLKFADANQKNAEKKAADAKKVLEKQNGFPAEILGPMPAFIAKLRGRYQYYIFLKVPLGRSKELYDYLKGMPSYTDIDVDPESLL